MAAKRGRPAQGRNSTKRIQIIRAAAPVVHRGIHPQTRKRRAT